MSKKEKVILIDVSYTFKGTMKVKALDSTDAIDIISKGFTIQIVTGDRCDDRIVDWDIEIKPVEQQLKLHK